MEMRKIKELEPHPLHEEIYRDSYDDELLQGIKLKGILTPLLITKDNVIISGNRRYKAAQELKLDELPVTISDLTDDIDIREAIIESNKQRVKTREQILREYKELKKIEEQRAKQRQGTRTDIKGNILENCPESQRGNASDIAAVKLQENGIEMSGRTADKGLKVIEAIDECEESGETEKVDELRTLLNKSIHSAFKQAKEEGLIEGEAIPDEIKGDIKKEFNPSDGKKGWTMWSWNPVTGCTHGCDYCYAEDIACSRHKSSFPYGFEPTFYEERLEAPKKMTEKMTENTKLRKKAKTDIRHRSVFVCMMGDLFCDGVSEEWIKKVLETVEEHSQFNFLFFTKNPQRMTEFEFPDNAWVGATVDRRFRIKDTEEAFKKIKAKVKMLSCEPLLEDLTEGSTRDLTSFLKLFDWVIIGAQNRAGSVPEIQPQWEWVENLLIQARKAGCLVYFRPGLKVKPQEYPVPSDFLQKRRSKLEEKLPEESLSPFTHKWEQIESHYNGNNEYIRNYKLEQLLRPEEEKFNDEEDTKNYIEELIEEFVSENLEDLLAQTDTVN